MEQRSEFSCHVPLRVVYYEHQFEELTSLPCQALRCGDGCSCVTRWWRFNGFDASLLSGADAGVVMELAGAVEAMAAVVKALAGVRAGECGTWKEAGDRSAAHHLARRSGMSVGLATEALATARRLSGLALLSASARSGALSAPQVAAVALAAEADPSAETALLSLAGRASLGELRPTAPGYGRRRSPIPKPGASPSTTIAICGAPPAPTGPGNYA